jgi:hypothetical protein
MKRLISFLTLLCAAGLPLTAAAFDYGSDQRLLAAEAATPSVPGGRGENNPFADAASHRASAVDDGAPAAAINPEVDADKRPAPRTPSARRSVASPAAAPGPGMGSPQRPPSALSWQSLLPGSIQ